MTGSYRYAALSILLPLLVTLGCSNETKAAPTKAEVTLEPGVFEADHPELFSLVKAESRDLPVELQANGTVNPDVSKTIHVTSLGSGRVIDLKVRLGDYVNKGQVLMVISSPDLGAANSDYQKAKADEELSRRALDRAQELYAHGAFAEKDLEAAKDTDDKAKVDLRTTAEKVRLLGGDPDHPGQLIPLRAPVSGTIVEQNVAGFEGIKSLDNTPNLFTIADLTDVWIVCDVYENDLGDIKVGDAAEIRLNAFTDRVLHGKIGDISRVLDPNTRSAKVRIVLGNADGSLRPGMFAVAKFRSRRTRPRVLVPSTAIMRLQDKDWVFQKEAGNKEAGNKFRRVEVHGLGTTSDGMQEIADGVKPGDEVVAKALEFSTAMAEQGK